MSQVEPRAFRLTDGRALTVRTVREGDAAALLEHGKRLLVTTVHTVITAEEFAAEYTVEKEREWARDNLDSPGKLAIIAEVEGVEGIVGLLNFHNHKRQRMAHHGHFGIGVDEPFRGKGVGRALITVLLDWARAHPVIEKVCLGVFETNVRAQKLYREMGFVEEGRRIGEFKAGPGEYVNDIQMSVWVKARA